LPPSEEVREQESDRRLTLVNDFIDKARKLLEDGSPEEALEILWHLNERLLGSEDRRDLYFLLASVLLDIGELESAKNNLAKALSLGEDSGLREIEAHLHLATGSVENALCSAEQAIRLYPDNAAAHHTLGIVLVFRGRLEDADRAFARAEELEPDIYFRPHRLSRRQFDLAVEKVLAALPQPFRIHLENVEIAVEDIPSGELLEEGAGYELLGLYRGGTIHTEEEELPDQILLFQRNIENVSPDIEMVLREIQDTVLHEVGHHLGLDEDQLQAIEEEWDGKCHPHGDGRRNAKVSTRVCPKCASEAYDNDAFFCKYCGVKLHV
jgi:predicted Zn-dependent protease with MMP-like domain